MNRDRMAVWFSGLAGALVTLFGLLLVVGAGREVVAFWRLQHQGQVVQATVIDLQTSRSRTGAIVSRVATGEYRPAGMPTVRFAVEVAPETFGTLAAGSRLAVRYVPDAPGIAQAEPPSLATGTLLQQGGMGLGVSLLGSLFAYLFWHRGR